MNMVQLDTTSEGTDIYSRSWEEEEVKKDPGVYGGLCSCHAIVHIILLCNRDISLRWKPCSKPGCDAHANAVYAVRNRVVIINAHALRAGVLGGDGLSLSGNTTLLGVTVGALLAAVKEVGIVLGDLRRVLGADLVDGLLEVALLGKVGLLGRAQGASLGCGSLLVGSSETLSIGGDTVLGRLGLTGGAGFTRLEVIGVVGGDGARVLLHLAEDILSSILKVLCMLVSNCDVREVMLKHTWTLPTWLCI